MNDSKIINSASRSCNLKKKIPHESKSFLLEGFFCSLTKGNETIQVVCGKIIWGKGYLKKGQPCLEIPPYNMIPWAGTHFYNLLFWVYFCSFRFSRRSTCFSTMFLIPVAWERWKLGRLKQQMWKSEKVTTCYFHSLMLSLSSVLNLENQYIMQGTLPVHSNQSLHVTARCNYMCVCIYVLCT